MISIELSIKMLAIFYKFVVIVDVVIGVVDVRCKHHADSSRREIIESTPNICFENQSLIWVIQKNSLFLSSIIEGNGETAAKSNKQLFQLLVSVPTTAFTSRNIVYPVATGNLERNILQLLHHGEVPPRVANRWQIYKVSVADLHN